jgi:hypothetical protein
MGPGDSGKSDDMTRFAAGIVAVIYAGLFTAFALMSGSGDAEGGGSLLSNLPNLLPWLPVWAILLAAWKNSAAGAVLFLFLAAASTMFFHTYRGIFPFLLISAPLIIISALFLIVSRQERMR